MPKESKAKLKERALDIQSRLNDLYPDAKCALVHSSPLELLIATILSAQCTDKRVNMVTPALFEAYPSSKEFAEADQEELEQAVRSTGFYRNKAKSIKGTCIIITEKHGGSVPASMDELLELPGVARKTANVVLGNAFSINDGIVVDTHVKRLSNRLGLSSHSDTNKIENDLMALVPQHDWTIIAHRLIDHGRAVCDARKPKCAECVLESVCLFKEKLL